MLILRDVLRFRAAEVAEAVGVTTTAVNSLLQRARAQLEQVSPTEDEVTEPLTAEQRVLLERYVKAFEDYDIPAMVELFTSDAVWEMPPYLAWFQGAEEIGHLVVNQCPAEGPGDQLMVPTAANGQPAYGLYMRSPDGVHRAFQLQVLTLARGGVSHVASFFDTSLFEKFGLPLSLTTSPPA